MKKVLLTTVMSLMMCCMGVYAQDYLYAPKANEKVLGIISVNLVSESIMSTNSNEGWNNTHTNLQKWYTTLLEEAKRQYPGKTVDIRNLEAVFERNESGISGGKLYKGPVTGKVVDLRDPEMQAYGNLSQALNKALRNVREGSRLAIDQVSVTYGMDKEALKDQLLDVLLDKGYKVIAKEYLEKLYEEQEAQQSGIYNENTTVKDNNFSAVGYYINVKVTETSLRVQVVNVSTGEYEGNATVNF